jgi:hypothetical protein
MDSIYIDLQHAFHQIVNLLTLQQPNGLIPGHIRFINERFQVGSKSTFPPLWPFVIEAYLSLSKNVDCLPLCYSALEKQIDWFEKNRQVNNEGFYYLDFLDNLPESGIENSIRFNLGDLAVEHYSCVDASAHVYSLYQYAISWGSMLGKSVNLWQSKAEALREFIQQKLFDKDTGFFHDQWAVGVPKLRRLTFEGIWPLVCGAASFEQARRVINENLLESSRFFTPHPITTAAIHEPFFDTNKWHGPVHNSMTFWAAKGCFKYNRKDAAKILLEQALDCTTHQFEKTGTLWEYYHPDAKDPQTLTYKPSEHYLGHNPLLAMAHLWQECNRVS